MFSVLNVQPTYNRFFINFVFTFIVLIFGFLLIFLFYFVFSSSMYYVS